MSDASPEVQTTPGARRRILKRGHKLGLLVLLLLLVVVTAGGWWTHPEAFRSGAGATMSLDPVPLSATPFYVGFAGSGASGHAETVTLSAVRIGLRHNTAGATATAAVCTRRPVAEGTMNLGTGTAATTRDLTKFCTRLRPIRPGVKMRLDEGREYLIATISAKRPGRAVFATADLTYSRDARHLYQRGTQHIEIGAITTVRVQD